MASVLAPSFVWTPYTHSAVTNTVDHASPAASLREKIPDDDLEPLPSSPARTSFKPYLKKLSFRDQNMLDLSRPSAENYSTTGIGFYEEPRSPTDIIFAQAAAKSRHARNTSNNSNFSIGSTLQPHQRPRAPFSIPSQHASRPYTPPISRSHTASSLLGSDVSGEAEDVMLDDDFHFRPRPDFLKRRSGSIGSLPSATPQVVQLQTSSSLTMLNATNYSESSLPSSPTGRSRGNTLRSVDTVGSSTRTSLDKSMAFIRAGSHKEDSDAMNRAAQINAARIAYAEKEEAKQLKIQRLQEKVDRKKQDKAERVRRKSETRSAAKSSSSLDNEKSELQSMPYSDHTPAHMRSLPSHVPTTAGTIPRLEPRSRAESQSVKSRWLSFLAWFRTRLFRMNKKLQKRH